MAEREVERWITVNGQHIPIFKGESKQDAYNRYVAEVNEDTKQKQIAKHKSEADKLNGKFAESAHDAAAKHAEADRKQASQQAKEDIKTKEDMAQFMYGESYTKLSPGLQNHVNDGMKKLNEEKQKLIDELRKEVKVDVLHPENKSIAQIRHEYDMLKRAQNKKG